MTPMHTQSRQVLTIPVEHEAADDLPGVCIVCNGAPWANLEQCKLHWTSPTKRFLFAASLAAAGVLIGMSPKVGSAASAVVVGAGVVWSSSVVKATVYMPICEDCESTRRRHRLAFWLGLLGCIALPVALVPLTLGAGLLGIVLPVTMGFAAALGLGLWYQATRGFRVRSLRGGVLTVRLREPDIFWRLADAERDRPTGGVPS